MKFIKKFENNNIPWEYKEIVRKCIDKIKANIDLLDPYHEHILNLMPNSRKMYFNFGETNINSNYDFHYNYLYILNNIKSLFNIVAMSDFNGKVAELIVEYLLLTKFNYTVKYSTQKQNRIGYDLISINNNNNKNIHQVKFLYRYYDDKNNIIIKNRFIEIKKTDIYDYLWFFVEDKKELVLLKKDDINVKQTDFGYIISYTKIKKYEISNDIIDSCKEKAESLIKGFDDIADSNYDNLLSILDKYDLKKRI